MPAPLNLDRASATVPARLSYVDASEEGNCAIATLGRTTNLRSQPDRLRASSSSFYCCPLHPPSFRVLAPTFHHLGCLLLHRERNTVLAVSRQLGQAYCSHFSQLPLTSNPLAQHRFPFLIRCTSTYPAPLQKHFSLVYVRRLGLSPPVDHILEAARGSYGDYRGPRGRSRPVMFLGSPSYAVPFALPCCCGPRASRSPVTVRRTAFSRA